jgi:DNA ligase-1
MIESGAGAVRRGALSELERGSIPRIMPLLLSELVSASREVAATSARLEKVERLAALLRRLAPDEIEIGVAMLSGGLRQGRIGLGWSTVLAAAQHEATAPAEPPATPEQLALDLPAPATGAPAGGGPLTLVEVDEAFDHIASVSGRGSARERGRLLAKLFHRATPNEWEFIVRLLAGELRQGALAGVMEEAVAAAASIPADEVRRALMLAGDLGDVARTALTGGPDALGRFRLRIFRPLKPMLAQTAEDLSAALERLGEAAFEFKLDGARVQAHKSGAEVRIYSRRLNDVTGALPDLVEAVRALPVREVVLDGEVIALRPDGTPHPFQTTMRRFGRKLDVEALRKELPLTPFFFDLLTHDGHDLFDAPARERFAALEDAAPSLVVPRIVTADEAEAQRFFDQALERGHEGLMAKSLDATYQTGRRGFGWLKIKPAHTLDLVVLAAEWGHGRRKGHLSNLHLGALDAATGDFVMLGKTFKGMTDEILEWQTKRFKELETRTEGNTVHVRPELVVEVAFSDVQESPQYPAGMALRFARIKGYREDKPASEADTIETVRAIMAGEKRSTAPRIRSRGGASDASQ